MARESPEPSESSAGAWLNLSGVGQPPSPIPTSVGSSPATRVVAADVTPNQESADGQAELPKIPGCEILAELGRGGMGVVYRGWQPQLKRPVAVKMMLSGQFAAPADMRRFRAEAEAVARIQHPNIVQIHEIGECDGRPYFCMEYCGGGALDRQLRGRPQPPKKAAEIVRILALAMQAAHDRGIVHRDLKPANVLLTDTAEPTLKISDFGLAKQLETGTGPATVATASGSVLGTPSYMAPEQAAGKVHAIGPAADIYALGAILYELLTGRPPFQGLTHLDTIMQVITEDPLPPRRFVPNVPLDLQTICLKALEKEPRGRYDSAAALAEDLSRFLAGEPVMARPLGQAARTWRWVKRRPAAAGLIVVSLLGAVLGLAGLLVHQVQLTRALQAAEDQRRRADQHFRDAKAAVDESFIHISQNRLLKEPGFETLRRDLLASARKYYERFGATYGNDPALAFELAQTQSRLGSITALTDGPAQAIPILRAAAERFASLSTPGPMTTAFMAARAENLQALAEQLSAIGDLESARVALVQAKEVLGPWRVDGPPELHTLQAQVHQELFHHFHAQGANLEAKKWLEAARTTAAALADRPTATLEDVHSHVRLQRCQALLFLRTGEPEEGAKLLRASVSRLQSFLPTTTDQNTASELFTELAERENLLGAIHFIRREYDQAQNYFAACADYHRRALERNPLLRSPRADLASALINQAKCAANVGAGQQALDLTQQAAEYYQRLMSEVPGHAEYCTSCVDALMLRASLRTRFDRLDEAQADLEAAVQTLDRALADQPQFEKKTDFRSLQLRLYSEAAMYFSQVRGDAAQAERYFQRALEVARRLAQGSPTEPAPRHFQRRLANSLHDLGEFYRDQKRFAEAFATLAEGRALQESLLESDPKDVAVAVELAWNYGVTGHVHVDGQQLEEALPWYAKAIAVLEPRYQVVVPEIGRPHPGAQRLLADAYQWQALTFDRLNRRQEADQAWEETIRLTPGPQKTLRKLRQLSIRLGPEEADALLAQVQSLAKAAPRHPEVQAQAAEIFAAAAALTTEPELLRQRTDLAFRFLEAAVAAGGFRSPRERRLLNEAAVWAPLRSDPRFEALLTKTAPPPSPPR